MKQKNFSLAGIFALFPFIMAVFITVCVRLLNIPLSDSNNNLITQIFLGIAGLLFIGSFIFSIKSVVTKEAIIGGSLMTIISFILAFFSLMFCFQFNTLQG
jgi:hypothetical protein